MAKSPKDTHGPIVKSGPTAGKNRSRNIDGSWRGKRSDSGKSRKSSGGCFLTATVCQYKGLADDCHQLEVLRDFRDGYLMNTIGGRALVTNYYQIAPNIVSRLNKDIDKEKIWQAINTCVAAIELDQYRYAINVYKNMVLSLVGSKI